MTELTYTKAGDYLIPDIQLEEMEDRPLGKYGRMRRRRSAHTAPRPGGSWICRRKPMRSLFQAQKRGKTHEGAGEDITPAVPGTDAKSVATPQEPTYQVGDTVYLEDTAYIVEEIGLFDVQLRDPALAYPVLRAESKERLELNACVQNVLRIWEEEQAD